MKTISFHSKEECDKNISRIISEKITGFLEKKDKVVLGIPGGRSVQALFHLLKDENVEWSKVHIFMVDERLVSLDDEQSNFKLARECFIDELVKKGKLPEENMHPFKVEEGVENYKGKLLDLGGIFDIVILGVGEDGHVAALFPNHHSLDEEGVFITMDDSPKPPAGRMSSSLSLLKRSDMGVILFYGEGKRKAYEMFKDEKVSSQQCPAKLVLKIKEVYVGTDLE